MKTYSPKEVSIIVGTLIVSNFESVSVELDEDEWSFVAGADGELTRIENANKLGTATLVLKQSAESNDALSGLAVTGGTFPFVVADKSGKSLHVMPEATIAKRPMAEYGKEASDREWTIKGKLSIHNIGGN